MLARQESITRSDLLSTILVGDILTIKAYVRFKRNAGLILDDHWTEFKEAIFAIRYSREREEILRLLINTKCKIQSQDTYSHYILKDGPKLCDYVDKSGHTLLFMAVEYEIDDIVKLLLTMLDDKVIAHIGNNGLTAFHYACIHRNPNIVQVFLDHGVYIDSTVPLNALEYRGCTALHLAVIYDRDETVKLLLTRGADINKKDENNVTSFSLACYTEKVNLADLFLFYATDTKEYCANGIFTKLHAACIINKRSLVEELLDHGYDVNCKTEVPYWRGYTPLHFAVAFRNINIVQLLLDRKAQVNARSASLRTPLHIACSRETNMMTNKVDVNIVELLIKNNANVHDKMANGGTALHQLFSSGHLRSQEEVVSVLVRNGIGINVQNNDGKCALHLACATAQFKAAVALLNCGADINLKDQSGETPLNNLYFHNQRNLMLMCLLCYGAGEDPLEIVTHAYKINMLGLLSPKNNAFLSDLLSILVMMDKINVESFYAQCQAELGRMKNYKIDAYNSLYSIFFKDAVQMTFHIKNDVLKDLLSASHFKIEYPLYGYLIEAQFQKGLKRDSLLTPVLECLELRGILPFACGKALCQYLSDDCLRNLYEAFMLEN